MCWCRSFFRNCRILRPARLLSICSESLPGQTHDHLGTNVVLWVSLQATSGFPESVNAEN